MGTCIWSTLSAVFSLFLISGSNFRDERAKTSKKTSSFSVRKAYYGDKGVGNKGSSGLLVDEEKKKETTRFFLLLLFSVCLGR